MVRVAYNHLARMRAQLAMEASQIVQAAAGQIALEIVASMEGQESPSAPGSPPAIVTGLFHDSIQTKTVGPLESMVYSNVEYAPHLEFGTVHMEARPSFVPAAEVIRPSFTQAMRALLGRLR